MSKAKPQALTFFGEPLHQQGRVFTDQNRQWTRSITCRVVPTGTYGPNLPRKTFAAVEIGSTSTIHRLDVDPHRCLRMLERDVVELAQAFAELAGGWVEGVDEEYLR